MIVFDNIEEIFIFKILFSMIYVNSDVDYMTFRLNKVLYNLNKFATILCYDDFNVEIVCKTRHHLGMYQVTSVLISIRLASSKCIVDLNHVHLKQLLLINMPWLTHSGRDKMAAISQTTHWNPFSLMKIFEFRLKFHWSLFLRFQLIILQHWSR